MYGVMFVLRENPLRAPLPVAAMNPRMVPAPAPSVALRSTVPMGPSSHFGHVDGAGSRLDQSLDMSLGVYSGAAACGRVSDARWIWASTPVETPRPNNTMAMLRMPCPTRFS